MELSPIQLLRAKYPSRDTALHALLADVGAKRNVEMRRKPWREGLAAKVDVFVKAAAARGLAGAVVRARNRDGETPVHVAARALNPHGPGGRAHCGPVNEDEAGAVMRKLLEDDPEAALCVDAGGRTPLLVVSLLLFLLALWCTARAFKIHTAHKYDEPVVGGDSSGRSRRRSLAA